MNGRPTDGIVHSARRILAILVRMAQTRLSLLAVEVVEEQRRIWLLVVLTALALLFGFMALLMASLLIVVAYWDDHRMLAIGGVLAFYVIAAGVTAIVLRYKALGKRGLFVATLDELAKDRAELERQFDASMYEER
jgi:uncharacterized membrane protein YqjE